MNVKEQIKFLTKNTNSLLVVHYSCQNLNDNNEGFSPRITSIAVQHVGSSTMHSFSIHLIAEIKKISRADIEQHYDELEATMLEDFYRFIQDHQDHYWLHWNMTNINFGFETIEHRYRVLTQKVPPKVDDSKKYNLSTLVSQLYGVDYVDHPKMPNLMELNGGKSRDFLTGGEEVTAFERKEYIKLHKSTMSKVYFFKSVFHKLQSKKLKTARSNLPAKLNSALESLPAKILALIAVLFSVGQLGYLGYKSLEEYSPSNVSEKEVQKVSETNKAFKSDS
ncbi:hypothetical protein U0N67_004972 [Vibrio parahaemolyticus]|uniref:hypothetical protein n=1 Tax=Vibrio harveyi group TaxID=717610 RepID=UPI0015DB05A3|nr:hypothetical protein [Vibrio parahaemolyticus]EHU5005532.1 hypothetical protein [Vibrio vulnificus]EHU9469856.1 hypothetical protein [Vibrio parahaemolyticus]EJU9794739.1 hypothetical protein [Vibrio parahaemolyticus]ELA8070636.1 hypothetical protein [Vibrio parahaemolyticus]ELU7468784.1 hypothetical protein [Vibrio parahaemolyticus]